MPKPKVRSGKRKPRVLRPKEKDLPPNYDSKFEYDLHRGLLKSWDFHNLVIPYTISHKYHADFIKTIDGVTVVLEAKGRFWDHAEYSKYLGVKKSLPSGYELVFLFASPMAAMPGATVRKDGTKRTHGEWATANGFRWYSRETLPNEWCDATFKEETL
jgi:hypothetical protein